MNAESGGLVRRIVSGGQTGVDRGALDAAIALGIAHGGWCPRGRMAEDGTIPLRYLLKEMDSPEYRLRTEKNVLDSDGTLILFRQRLFGGTLLTQRLARRHGKPCLAVDLAQAPDPRHVGDWLRAYGIRVLNVAGPRESSNPGMALEAKAFLVSLLAPPRGARK